MNTLKKIQVERKDCFSSSRIYALLIFFLVFSISNAQIIDSLIFNRSFKKFKIHLTHDKDYVPVLISHNSYTELDSIFSNKNDLNVTQAIKGLDLSKFYSVNVGTQIYLVSPDGSTVFLVEKGKGIKQLNYPNTTKSYFKCSIFSHRGSIYRLGGYGYWNYKSQLFKFDFEFNKWQLITSALNDDLGFKNPHTVLVDNKVHVISPVLINNFNNNILKNDYIYTIDLVDYNVDQYRFDFTEFSPYFDEFFSRTNYFKVKNGIGFINTRDNSKAIIFDLKIKSSRKVQLKTPIITNSKIVVSEKKLHFLRSHHGNSIQKHALSERVYLSTSKIVKTYKVESFKETNFTHWIALLSLAFLIFPIVYIKGKTSPFLLDKKYIKKGNNSIKLDIDEKYFVECLIKDAKVENQTLISYFDRDGKSYDLNVKRKNSMISKLSLKFYSQFKKELFIKAPSANDKRQGVYVLKQKLILANKKS